MSSLLLLKDFHHYLRVHLALRKKHKGMAHITLFPMLLNTIPRPNLHSSLSEFITIVFVLAVGFLSNKGYTITNVDVQSLQSFFPFKKCFLGCSCLLFAPLWYRFIQLRNDYKSAKLATKLNSLFSGWSRGEHADQALSQTLKLNQFDNVKLELHASSWTLQ